jgi:hypothetical protein
VKETKQKLHIDRMNKFWQNISFNIASIRFCTRLLSIEYCIILQKCLHFHLEFVQNRGWRVYGC